MTYCTGVVQYLHSTVLEYDRCTVYTSSRPLEEKKVPGTRYCRTAAGRDVSCGFTSLIYMLSTVSWVQQVQVPGTRIQYRFVRTIWFTIAQLESRASAQPHSTSLTCVAAQLFDGSCPLSPIKQKNRTHHLKVNGNHELPHYCRTCKLRHLRRWVNEMSLNKRYGCLESMNWTMLWSAECWWYSTFVDSSQIIDGEIPELNAEIKNSPRQGSHNFEQIRSLPSRRRPMIVLEVPTLWCLYA